jgi:hypothetical protein
VSYLRPINVYATVEPAGLYTIKDAQERYSVQESVYWTQKYHNEPVNSIYFTFGHYFGREVAPKRNVFLGKNIADTTVKKFFSQTQISIKKNKNPSLAKNFTK